MPTVVTHAVVGGLAAHAFGEKAHRRRIWDAAILVSVLPDADVLGFRFGVAYESCLGHRGFFHSLLFSAIVGAACVLVLFGHVPRFSGRWWKHVLFFTLVGASHGALDAFTDGGLGIAFLAPLSNSRFFAPWTPIPVCSIGLHDVFTGRAVPVIGLEAVYVWVPALLAVVAVRFCRRRRERRVGSGASDGDA